MKTRNTLLLLYFLGFALTGRPQPSDTTFFVEVMVQEQDARTPVPNAEVYFIGRDDTRTDADGRALFPGTLPGPVDIIVRASGYQYARFQRDIFRDRVLTLELRPVPSDSFSIKGKVVHAQEESLPKVRVRLQAGKDFRAETQTDGFGYFQFLIAEADLANNMSYHLDFQKTGYSERLLRDRTLDYKQRDHDLGIIGMQPSIPTDARGGISRPSPFSLVPGLHGTLVTGDAGANDPFLVPSLFLLYKSPFLRDRLAFTAGLFFPFHMTTLNTYETLAGQTNELPTEYQIKNFLTLGVRYYLFGQDDKRILRPFGETTLSLGRQSPLEKTFEEGAFQLQRDNYTAIAPRLSVGLGIDFNRLEVEPHLSVSTFRFRSESFEFNYFGQATPVMISDQLFLVQAGINVQIKIPYRP